MDLTLSWDLFILFFFAVVAAYSFIIGKHQTLKILIAIYIAILATQGIGNIFERISGESEPVYRILKVMGVNLNLTTMSISKLVFFMIVIISIALKGGFSVEYGKSHSSIVALAATALFGLSTAGLIVVSLLTFVAGAPLLDPSLGSTEILVPLMKTSRMVQAMVLNQDLWFALPALLLVGFGLVREEGGEE
ncbi:hypothetical protein HOF56_00795 [Candidatus Peribacteria bacterium]|jgi:hypothetical protein|nr:hypothetical protein [Candidatus Peribacteria bacterium]MBT4021356.1 hypothetical protein [Candidatus Peribacteria bacterium]MBT4241254.1 hypothetical protein [Candidatus Peribacteria bacterium]MBT4474279.1 hypothetical protein [Candidatus Peribacteria bacterium]